MKEGDRLPQPPAPLVRLPVDPEDVFLEEGYHLEPVVVGLTYVAAGFRGPMTACDLA